MSAIGRIIIVLNLLLAAVFLGYAASMLSSTDEYKAEIASLNTQSASDLAAKDEIISGHESKAKTLSDEARDFREARDANESKAQALRTQLDEEKRRGDAQATELTKITSAMGDLNGTIGRLTSQKDDAVQARHEAESAREDSAEKALAAELAQRDASDATDTANAMIAELQGQIASMETEVMKLDTQLTLIAKASGIGRDQVMAQPLVEGAVVSIANDLSPALVMLNVGSNDDVRVGTVFDIFTGGTYKGQCRVEQVEAGVCSAVVVRLQAGRSINPGDTASTKL